MSGVRYLPGEDWLSVVRGGVVVLVPAGTAPEVLDRLWNQLGENPHLQAVLPIVAGGFGQGLESMPPFGVVSYTDRLHVLLRGAVRLTVAADGSAAPVELSGEDVTTWTERIIDGGGFTLRAGPARGAEDAPAFPLEAGIVRASGVSVGAVPAGASGALAPVAEAVPSRAAAAAASADPVTVAAPSAFLPAPDVPAPDVQTTDAQATDAPGDEPDPERAMTGALEAEESATINPSLYLTSADSSGDDDNAPTGGDGSSGDGAPGDDGSSDDDGAPGASTAGGQDPDLQLPGGRDPRVQDLNSQDPDPESQSTGYDHLWDRTVVRRVEDAAVRPPEEDDLPAAPDAPSPEAPAAEPVPESEPKPKPRPEPEPAAPSEPGPTPAPTPIPVSAPGELIDSVPWIRRSPEPDSPAAPLPVPHGEPAPTPPSTGQDSDHDGHTIMRSDLHTAASSQPGSSAQPGSTSQPESDVRPGTGPLVLARLCGQGHANPPEAPDCGLCSQPLDGEPRRVRRPSLGTMRISTGEVVELDQSLIIGRQPSVSRVQGSGMPKLVQVTSAGGDISRSHVEVRLDGWHVLLCDLKATNGTVLIRAGQPPRRLGEGESAFLLDGDVAQLGDDVFLRFEGLR